MLDLRPHPNGIYFRDIRADLNARLRNAVSTRDLHRDLADRAEIEIDILTKMIDRENARFGQQDQALNAPPVKKPLREFVLDRLAENDMNKPALGEAAQAAGYFKPEDYPLRAIHAITVNLVRANLIEEGEDGLFRRVEEEEEEDEAEEPVATGEFTVRRR